MFMQRHMIETYKLVHNKYDGDVSSLVKMHKNYVPREGMRGHGLKLYQQQRKFPNANYKYMEGVTRKCCYVP